MGKEGQSHSSESEVHTVTERVSQLKVDDQIALDGKILMIVTIQWHPRLESYFIRFHDSTETPIYVGPEKMLHKVVRKP